MMPSADGAVSGRYICGMEGGGDDGLYYSTTTDYRLQGGGSSGASQVDHASQPVCVLL